MKRRFLLGLVGVITLLTTVITTPTLAVSFGTFNDKVESSGGTTVTHKEFDLGNNEDNTATQTTQITVKKTREATTEELKGAWTTSWNGRSHEWTYSLSDGSHYEGWLNDNGTWYYIKFGKMLTNLYVEGYYLGPDGIITTPPATFNYHYYLDISTNGRTITPQDVQATKEVRERLLKEGWINIDTSDSYWTGDQDVLILSPGKDGIKCTTACKIIAGVGTVTLYTELGERDYGNRKNWIKGDGHTIELPLDKYLEYKKEGKVVSFTESWTIVFPKAEREYKHSEYLKDGVV